MTSPFETTHNVVMAPTDFAEALRIIAHDAKLTKDDRETLRGAAEELDFCRRTVASLYTSSAETSMALTAAREQLAALRKQLSLAQPLPWTTMCVRMAGPSTMHPGWTR